MHGIGSSCCFPPCRGLAFGMQITVCAANPANQRKAVRLQPLLTTCCGYYLHDMKHKGVSGLGATVQSIPAVMQAIRPMNRVTSEV